MGIGSSASAPKPATVTTDQGNGQAKGAAGGSWLESIVGKPAPGSGTAPAPAPAAGTAPPVTTYGGKRKKSKSSKKSKKRTGKKTAKK